VVAAGEEELSLGGIGLRLGAVLVLVLLNGFFVAAEFALVAARRSKIDQLAESGDAKAGRVRYAQEHLDRYISGTQLGITLASLALGWIGEPALASLVDRALAAVGVGRARPAGRRRRRTAARPSSWRSPSSPSSTSSSASSRPSRWRSPGPRG
jgi:hypothetical protein